jgi:bile acid:Na+ symporter, BASS family
VLERHLLWWLLALSGTAYFWPRLVGDGLAGWDPFLALKSLINALIVATMFCIGMILPRHEARHVLRRWPTVLGGVAAQYLIMPTLALAFGRLCGLTGDQYLSLVMVGCVPGAMASNILTLLARGNASYSVSLTTTATLLSPVAVPLGMMLALQSWHYHQVLLSSSFYLAATVVLPVLAGYALVSRFPRGEALRRRVASLVANTTILLIVASVVGTNREHLELGRGTLLFALLGVNLLGYLGGYASGRLMRLDEPMRRALTLEIGMQNAGLGVALAGYLFPHAHTVAIGPALYTFGCMLTGTLLARYWAPRPSQAD